MVDVTRYFSMDADHFSFPLVPYESLFLVALVTECCQTSGVSLFLFVLLILVFMTVNEIAQGSSNLYFSY